MNKLESLVHSDDLLRGLNETREAFNNLIEAAGQLDKPAATETKFPNEKKEKPL